ncbi:MAG: hypothetical protein ACPKPY_08125 [Nitrososphaeraceae archaeon]
MLNDPMKLLEVLRSGSIATELVKPMAKKRNYDRIDRVMRRFNTEDILSGIIEFQYMDLADNLRLNKAELIAGVLLKYNINNSKYKYLFRDSERLLVYAEKVVLAQGISEIFERSVAIKDASFEEKKKVEKSVMMKSKHIFHRGDAYINQLIEFSSELYCKFDQDINQAIGFTFSECRNLLIFIYQKYHKVTNNLNKKRMESLSVMGREVDSSGDIMQSVKEGYIYRIKKTELYDKFNEDKVNNMIEYLKVDLGIQSDFNKIEDFNILYAKPIIDFGNYIYVALPINSIQNLPKLFHYEFIVGKKINKEARNRYTCWRGEVLEKITVRYMRRLFNKNKVYQSLYYYDGRKRFEADVTAIKDNTTIICECKSKLLLLDTLKGDIESLDNDFQAAVGKAYEQAVRTQSWIIEEREFEYIEESEEIIRIKLPSKNKIFKLCVVADHLGWIPASISDYIPGIPIEELPLVINIYDLDIITKECNNFKEFKEYLECRINYKNRLMSMDELEIFLAIRSKKNIFEEAQEKDMVFVDRFTVEIDQKYYQKAYEWLMKFKV